MLLSNSNFKLMTEDQASEFVSKHEKEIINYISQYASVIDDTGDRDLYDETVTTAVVLYLLFGESPDVIDRPINLEQEESAYLDNFDENLDLPEYEFFSRLWAEVNILVILSSLASSGLIQSSKTDENGQMLFSLTDDGKSYVEKLLKEK